MVNKARAIKQLRESWKDSTGETLSKEEAERMLGPMELQEMRNSEEWIKTSKGRRKVIW